MPIEIALRDNDSAEGEKNADIIRDNAGILADVTLQGRTLYKDGDWNTLCLPFDVTLDGSSLEDATVKKLNTTTSNLTDGTLTLNFEDETTTMTVGTPYIIKWDKANDYVDDDAHNLVTPVFTGVTIDNTMRDANFTGCSFKGVYSNTTFETENKSILLLGGGNTLYWPQSGACIKACRAYFELNNGAGVREFRLNFGEEETTGIPQMRNEKGEMRNGNDEMRNAAYHDLQGRKVNGKPTKAGLYINNGRKIVLQ